MRKIIALVAVFVLVGVSVVLADPTPTAAPACTATVVAIGQNELVSLSTHPFGVTDDGSGTAVDDTVKIIGQMRDGQSVSYEVAATSGTGWLSDVNVVLGDGCESIPFVSTPTAAPSATPTSAIPTLPGVTQTPGNCYAEVAPIGTSNEVKVYGEHPENFYSQVIDLAVVATAHQGDTVQVIVKAGITSNMWYKEESNGRFGWVNGINLVDINNCLSSVASVS